MLLLLIGAGAGWAPGEQSTAAWTVMKLSGGSGSSWGKRSGGAALRSARTELKSCATLNGYQSLPDDRTMLVRAAPTNRLRAAVIMLHGYTATPEGEEAVSGWTGLMAGTDALVAYPEGSPTPYGGYGWSTGAARFATTGTNDVADIDNVISELTRDDCVNPREVLVAGESNGSGLGLILGCNRHTSSLVRLFALAIPAVDTHVLAHCKGAGPFALLVIASLHDRTVTYDGQYPPGLAPFSPPLLWFEEVALRVNRCEGLETAGVPDGVHYWYGHCAAPTNFFVADDGQHTWPGGPEGAGGLPPGRFPAAEIAWCASGLRAIPAPVDCTHIDSLYGLRR
ncbi:MAG TPA: hypothetical protein VEJ84_10630 [Acidimicrobiales bacterium]|nr:hypothetical protein [Acidimicrobiales bacterium]